MTTAINYTEARRLAGLPRQGILALRAPARRGRVRFVRVALVENFSPLQCAAVGEIRTGTHHVVRHRFLAPLNASRGFVRQLIHLCAGPAENPAVPITASPADAGQESGPAQSASAP